MGHPPSYSGPDFSCGPCRRGLDAGHAAQQNLGDSFEVFDDFEGGRGAQLFTTNQIQTPDSLIAAIRAKASDYQTAYNNHPDLFSGRDSQGNLVEFAKADVKARDMLVLTPANPNFPLTRIAQQLELIEVEFGIEDWLFKKPKHFTKRETMDDRERTDSAKVYFNTREKVFLVVAQAIQKSGMRAEIGDPIRINDSELESRIGDVLIRALNSFKTNIYSDDKGRRYSDEQYRAFRKEHLGVTVERSPSGDVIIVPLHHSKGGYSGSYEEKIVVGKADIPTKIPAALRQAFGLAT